MVDFRYPLWLRAIVWTSHIFGFPLPLTSSVLIYLFVDPARPWWWSVEFFQHLPIFLVWTLLSAVSWWTFRTCRPIRVDESKIMSLLFGRPWRSIRWDERPRITKQTMFDEAFDRVFISIAAGPKKVVVRGELAEFDDFRRRINVAIEQYNLEVTIIDKQGKATTSERRI